MCVATIRVRQTCVQTAWHGGCEQFQNTCSQQQVNQIGAALCAINAKVNACSLSGLQNLKDCIRNAFNDVNWTCGTLSGNAVAQTNAIGGNEITLTPAAFSSTVSRFEAIVFHELIHHCGGTELDAEAFENHCYASGGRTAPTSSDFPDFRNDGGNFVTWNPTTGQVTTTAGDVLNVNNAAFVDPSPPTGGGGW